MNYTLSDDWQGLLEECLSHEVAGIRLKAAEAHSDFFTEYYTSAHISPDARNVIVDRYLDNLSSNNQINRMGFAQAIGESINFCNQAIQRYRQHNSSYSCNDGNNICTICMFFIPRRILPAIRVTRESKGHDTRTDNMHAYLRAYF